MKKLRENYIDKKDLATGSEKQQDYKIQKKTLEVRRTQPRMYIRICYPNLINKKRMFS